MTTQYIWRGPICLKVLDIEMMARLKVAAAQVEGEAKRLMGLKKTGKWYRMPHSKAMYQASAPGEAPAVRTGELQQRITHQVPFKLGLVWHCFVGVFKGEALKYARVLEFGNARIKPRPFLWRALVAMIPQIRLILAGKYVDPTLK